ncbi:uncharacterized protein LOC110987257 isoform X1 [Acanthaster planci]|uniref:Uncharacterized protein LOC110987257 isoform X1 n=1 Tax=Acanthaster planci TaxID=133434 RepID=A0A8B7ZKG9_ACAPL|nr:uncharacterized protein LOC110987257 isoform X1 [Acanthaster planci]
MSLVNYNSSSDDETSNAEEETEEQSNVGKRAEEASSSTLMNLSDLEEDPRSKSSLFSSLPAPKLLDIHQPEETDDIQFPATASTTSSSSSSTGRSLNLPAPKKKSAQPIKITAPSLPETHSDDDEEEPLAKKARPAKTKHYLGRHSLGSPAINSVASHNIGGNNHLAGGGRMDSRNSSSPGPDRNLLRKKKCTAKERGEHTMEELLELSRSAMEQLHQKLELQRHQMVLLSGGGFGLHQTNSTPSFPKAGPAGHTTSNATQLQGLAQVFPPALGFQGSPVLNAALHPGLASLMQAPGLDLPRNAGLLGSQSLPFASAVNVSAANHDLTKSLLSPFPFPAINPGGIAGLQPFPLGSAVGISQPLAQPGWVPNTHPPSPPADSDHSPQVTHKNCCGACLKKIDLLEQKVKKILEHLITKELAQGSTLPPVLDPFPAPTSLASQSPSPQDGHTFLNTSPSGGSSSVPSSSALQVGQEMQNAFMQAVHHEQSSPFQSSTKPRIVYPQLMTDPLIPVKISSAAEHKCPPKLADPPITTNVAPAFASLCSSPSDSRRLTPSSVNACSSQTKGPLLLSSKITLPAENNDKYAYQSLMRYRGTSKLFKIDYDQHAAHKSNIHFNQGGDSSHLSVEDTCMLQTDHFQFPLEIYSAADFHSLPSKIQYILNVVERDKHGKATKLEVKQEILNSLAPYIKDRNSISRRLADVLFTDDERCYCNCSGWRKPAALDPIRMQALTDAVFKLCPCPEEQKKHLWHECVKSIDAASRHIVRVRKNKGKMPRHGKWLPTNHQEPAEQPLFAVATMEVDPSHEGINYDNLPVRLQSVLDITQRDANGKVCKVEIKEPVLVRFTYLSNSRLNVACQLANILFTPAEREGASCLGRPGTRQLDSIRLDALREGTFRICPAPLTEQKHLWSYCVKAIDRLSVNPDMSYPTSSATLVYPNIKAEDETPGEYEVLAEDISHSSPEDEN